MLTKRFTLLALPLVAALTLGASSLFAQGKIDLQQTDTLHNILERQVGQVVELRMTSGEKIGGKVEKVNEDIVHLSQLTGAEFYDAAVDLNAVAAVVVRTKAK
ncbi:MAG: hypothetical protein JO295_02405 [Verrucomicrobia bacterium]|nr:hypothetical protein [Verrucomicrobiota bacterium]